MGHLPNLKVLDIINNRIKNVPLSFSNLDLDAFWIDGSQVGRGEIRREGEGGGGEGGN